MQKLFAAITKTDQTVCILSTCLGSTIRVYERWPIPRLSCFKGCGRMLGRRETMPDPLDARKQSDRCHFQAPPPSHASRARVVDAEKADRQRDRSAQAQTLRRVPHRGGGRAGWRFEG